MAIRPHPTQHSISIQIMTTPPPAISIHQLNHIFGSGQLRKQVLTDITLDIATGEIVIMTGPSGSGKTTLLTLIGGLQGNASDR